MPKSNIYNDSSSVLNSHRVGRTNKRYIEMGCCVCILFFKFSRKLLFFWQKIVIDNL